MQPRRSRPQPGSWASRQLPRFGRGSAAGMGSWFSSMVYRILATSARSSEARQQPVPRRPGCQRAAPIPGRRNASEAAWGRSSGCRSGAGSTCRQPLRAIRHRVLVADGGAGDSIYTADLSGPVAIAIGAEGRGVSPGLLALAHGRLRIPMEPGLESLNAAAAAAAVVFFEWRRRRAIASPPGESRTIYIIHIMRKTFPRSKESRQSAVPPAFGFAKGRGQASPVSRSTCTKLARVLYYYQQLD